MHVDPLFETFGLNEHLRIQFASELTSPKTSCQQPKSRELKIRVDCIRAGNANSLSIQEFVMLILFPQTMGQ